MTDIVFKKKIFFFQATGKEWTKKQLQQKFKSMCKGEKQTVDEKRMKAMRNFVQKTGNNPAPEPFVQTPADDILPGRVDPRLLSGTDPVCDKFSIVTVAPGSCFASGQELSGVGMSRFAPKFGRFAPAAATATSGLYEAQAVAQSTRATQQEFAAESLDLENQSLDVSNERWAQDMINDTEVSGPGAVRTVFVPVNTSTPTRSPHSSFNDTFSTANITPIMVSSNPTRRLTMTPTTPPAIPALAPLPAVATVAPVAPAAGGVPAAAATTMPAIPVAGSVGVPVNKRKRKRGAAPAAPVVHPTGSSSLMDHLSEKSRLARIVASETIRLNRIEKMARIEVAHEEAMYWRLRREALVTDLLAKGANVSEEYTTSTDGSPLLSGALAVRINVDEGERNRILTVMHSIYLFFIYGHILHFLTLLRIRYPNRFRMYLVSQNVDFIFLNFVV